MTRERISTTVDRDLLGRARAARGGVADAQLIDAALAALLRESRRAEIDAAYDRAYTANPLDTPDDWGDLASFREAAASS